MRIGSLKTSAKSSNSGEDRLVIRSGEIFAREGDRARSLYSILSGSVRVFRQLDPQRRQIVAFLFQGDTFGLGYAVEGVYSLSAEAIKDTVVHRIAREDHLDLARKTPAFSKRLLDQTHRELAFARAQIVLLGRKTATEKVCDFIASIARSHASRGGAPDQAPLPMTRGDIGDHLGLTIETVSRVMSRLRRQGVIDYTGPDHVTILQSDILATMAANEDSVSLTSPTTTRSDVKEPPSEDLTSSPS